MTVGVATFAVRHLPLERGGSLADARLVYSTFGELSPSADNAILFPTAFGGRHTDNEWLIGPGQPLDTDRYFVIVPNLLGNGVSSSPSNHEGPFPAVTVRDNVHLQSLLLDHLSVDRLALVLGYSMGGQQAYEWAATYPDRVSRLACICSSARTSPWQQVFLQSVRAVLELHDGRPGDGERRIAETLGRVWAPWGFSSSFYDENGFEALGHPDPTAFIKAYWMDRLATFRVADLAAMLDTWAAHDLGARDSAPGLEQALSQITCPTLLISSRTDQYFRLEYAVQESRLLPSARLVELDSTWGHVAGRGFGEADGTTIREALRAHLATGGAP